MIDGDSTGTISGILVQIGGFTSMTRIGDQEFIDIIVTIEIITILGIEVLEIQDIEVKLDQIIINKTHQEQEKFNKTHQEREKFNQILQERENINQALQELEEIQVHREEDNQNPLMWVFLFDNPKKNTYHLIP